LLKSTTGKQISAMHTPRFWVILFLIFWFHSSSFAQDTLKITVETAERLFLKNNVSLLAASMQVEAQAAQIIQAKVYPNPVFTVDINAYDPENDKLLHIGNSGQKAYQLEQLIVLGGKRKAEIEIAKTNAQIASIEFEQLLRHLKFQLHTHLYTVGLQQQLLAQYNAQLALLSNLVTSYEHQTTKGNIPLKDVVRLKGAYLKLNNDRAELIQQFFESQSVLQTLLQTSEIIYVVYSEQEVERYLNTITLDEIKSFVIENKPELKKAILEQQIAQQTVSYQKRLAIPDINLFTSYDQRSGAFNNQINAGISVPLPLWNRNQGNIKTSEFKAKEATYLAEVQKNEILSQVQNTYALYLQTVSEYRKSKSMYNEDFEITLQGMHENFSKRNVSIIEFIDFFEAYNEVQTELARIKTQLVTSGEQLNLLTGKDIF
jgi:cobalt-zinc-cadmium efflux system outer membrane protein